MNKNSARLSSLYSAVERSWPTQETRSSVSTPNPNSGAILNTVVLAYLKHNSENRILSHRANGKDTAISPINTGYYKFGYSDPLAAQYYNNSLAYEVFDHIVGGFDEYARRPADFTSSEQTTAINHQSQRMSNVNVNTSHRDCPRGHHSSEDYQVIYDANVMLLKATLHFAIR